MTQFKPRQHILISQIFHPDEQATSQLFSDLFVRLTAMGHNLSVLSGKPAVTGRLAAGRETWNGISIFRGGIRVDGKKSFAARGLAYASYSLWLAWRLVFCTPASARVLVVTNPPFAPVIVWLCSRLRRWRYDVFLLDVYPDGLVAVGGLAEGALVARIWRACNRRALLAAGRVLVLGRDMARLVETRYAVPTAKVDYFPHWSAHAAPEWKRAEATRLWRDRALDGKFVVQYSGNMGLWHDIETIVRAAGLLQGEQDIHFLMIGGGMRRAAAESLARSLGLANMIWLPYQPRETLDDSLACCHAALISQRAGLEGVAVPCKLYGILASGRAVLAQVPLESEAALVTREEQCGLVIAPGEAQALAESILTLSKDRDRAETMGRNARAAYLGKYTLDMAARHFENLGRKEEAS